MITKKVHMNNTSKSSFSRLISYITDSQSKLNRVGDISITNCQSDNLDWAVLEIKNTQSLNVRATSDKTYHLLISFPSGENVDKETLSAIEDELCNSLGFSEHQRISVVHHDTDNLHIHVAINKIHPTKLTLHEPYNDYYIRNNVCLMLEDKYNLQKDNHINNKSCSQNAANDMEKIAGIESLITYISKLNLSNAKNWDELHSILNENGLEIKLRANGVVFENIKSGLTVKGSSIGYSKSKLEKKLGVFTENKNFKHSSRSYRKKPVNSNVDTTELFLKYKKNKDDLKTKKSNVYKNARLNRDRLIQEAKNKAKQKRTVLKNTKNNPFKKLLYKSIYSTLLNDIQQIKKSYNTEILAAKKIKPMSWLQWLQNEAKNGDKKALEVLKNRNPNLKSNDEFSIYSEQSSYADIIPGIKIDNVTKNGNIIYNIAGSKIKDKGTSILTSSNSTKDGLEAAILMAKYRYGSNLNVNGSKEFKLKIVNIVVEKNININFSDSELEKYKNSLLGAKHDKSRNGRSTSENKTTTGVRTTGTRTTGTRTEARKKYVISRTINTGRIDTRTTTHRSDNLRKLSECNMASIERRSQVFLSINAGNNLENNRTRSSDSVRWNVNSERRIEARKTLKRHFIDPRKIIFWGNNLKKLSECNMASIEKRSQMFLPKVNNNLNKKGIVNVFGYAIENDAILAADKYIKERNEKSKIIFDIKNHIHYNELKLNGSSVHCSYNGMRYIDGKALALFETDNNSIVVIPVSKNIENKLRKCSRGHSVTINKDGGFNINKSNSRRKR